MGSDIDNSTPIGEPTDSGGLSKEDKIVELNNALNGTIVELKKLCNHNLGQITILICINLFLLGFAYCFGKTLYNYKEFGELWTWQLIYFTAIRIVLVTGLVSLIVFTVNLLRYYLENYKSNRDKLFVTKSAASLIIAGSDFVERSQLYNKLLDVILADNSNKSESIKIETIASLSDILKEALKK